MESVPSFIQFGAVGLMASVFLGLYLQERREHKVTQGKVEALLEARRQDARETMDSVTRPMLGIAQTLGQIETKLVISKGNGE